MTGLSFRKIGLPLLAVLLLLALFAAPSVRACSCVRTGTVLDEYNGTSNIVILEVIAVEKAAKEEQRVDDVRATRLRVERVFKGGLQVGDELTFAQGGGGDCVWTFDEKAVGKRFLFYLGEPSKKDEPPIWWASTCSRSKVIEFAADDLLFLEKRDKVMGKTRLSGTLGSYQPAIIEGEESRSVFLSGNKVRVVGEKKTYELTTDANGVYEIYDLPPGIYTVKVEVPDKWTVESADVSKEPQRRRDASAREPQNPRRVVIEPGAHAYANFHYTIDNAVRGRVFDTAGKPMPKVCLKLLPARGVAARYFRGFACTDEGGRYEMRAIPPGSYILVANAQGRISSTEPFPTLYYPGVTEREKAGVLHINLGDRLEEVNVAAPQMAETVTIEGVCRYADGAAAAKVSIGFTPEKEVDGIDGKASIQTDAQGRFSLKVLRGVAGKIQGRIFAYSGMFENCPKVEELLKKIGGRIGELSTNTVDLAADALTAKVELVFPFPLCKRVPVDR